MIIHGKFSIKLFFRTYRLSWLVLLLTLGVGSVQTGYAAMPVTQPSPIVVNTFQDTKQNDGFCSLREAIIAANSDKRSGSKQGECAPSRGADTILLQAGAYILTRSDTGSEDAAQTGDLDIKSNITLLPDPQNPGPVSIDASGITDRVFHIFAGPVTIEGVTIIGGTVTGDGAGIYNLATLNLKHSTVQNNRAGNNGGGIYNRGTLTITESTISGNQANRDGGGIYNQTGTLTLNNSTVSGNTSNNSGGGLYHHGGTTNLNNVTIAVNSADHNGDNVGDGGGIRLNAGRLNFKNSLIAGNHDNSSTVQLRDCSGTLQSLGYNLIGQATGCFVNGDATGNISGQDARLGPLADNGGPTHTHALDPTSPAVDGGNNLTCLPTDQRGVVRPQGATCDIGAFEAENVDPRQTGPIFEVNNPADTDDGVCTVGDCTLREAIQAANTRPNDNVNSPDQINFLAGIGTIQPAAALPAITNPVIIDGAGELVILDGELAGPDTPGLTISAGGNSVIRGLIIRNFGSHGILLTSNNPAERNAANTIADNLITLNGGDGLHISASSANIVKNNNLTTNTGAGVVLTDGASNNTIGELNTISYNGGDGVQVALGSDNSIVDNTIDHNQGAGVRIVEGNGNTISRNSLFDNAQLGIDLGNDGVTLLDVGDADPGPNNQQNSPVLFRATPTGSTNELTLNGRLNSQPNTSYTVEFFANPTCDPTNFGQGQQFIGSLEVTTAADSNDIYFEKTVTINDPPLGEGQYVTATTTDAAGNSSEFSPCVVVSPDNDIWPRALELTSGETKMHYIDLPGRSRWYKFAVQPDSKVIIKLTHLPADYDLFLYSDIQATYEELTNPDSTDLLRLSAEFAPGSPSPGSPSPGSPSPGSPSPGSPSPGSPSLNQYSPGSPSPGSPSPGSPSPGSPSLYDYAPGSPSPGSPSPGSPSPGSPSFASAETRSFITASATDGTVEELIIANSWNNTGDFYVRFTGDNGAFNLAQPATIQVNILAGNCANVNLLTRNSDTPIAGGFVETLILHDLGRLDFDASDPAEATAFNALPGQLQNLASRVNGVVVDVGQDAGVQEANTQADALPECPFAKNLVAESIKGIIDSYRESHSELKYIVLIGSDNDIPFFRYPDRTLLGKESAYAPPVEDNTASQASLQLDYILSQDAYGASANLAVGGTVLPVPDLAVGRLVETPTDIITMLDAFAAAYDSTSSKAIVSPDDALVTGYDFLEDGALDVVEVLGTANGLAAIDTDLIVPQNLPPEDGWDADQLRAKLLDTRRDLIYLAGHFSANSALAADYDTYMITTELTEAEVDLTNAIIFSPGCHSGYNIVNEHNLPGYTFEPDWAQAFARKGATLLAGTGYQYGDTEFVEYSERLYLNFAEELRTRPAGETTVAVGQALVKAKQRYLAGTPFLRGMHEKALLEATLFGLPMLRVDMPGDWFAPPSDASIITEGDLSDGNELGMQTADIALTTNTSLRAMDVINLDTDGPVTLTWLQGRDGVVTNHSEPVLPRQVDNVSVDGKVLRGVGFISAAYQDETVIPLVGRPTTELAPVLSSFFSDIFFPTRPWNVNYFESLSGGLATRLMVLPAQVRTDEESDANDPLSIRRKYGQMTFRLYYLGDQNDNDLDLVDAPSIVNVSANNDITFKVAVVGDPLAEVEDVWVTYTVCPATSKLCNGMWRSEPLVQTVDTRMWEKTVSPTDLGAANAQEIRYIVQACNAVGLCSMATNRGAYFTPGQDIEPILTALKLDPTNPAEGTYGASATLRATLTLTDVNGPPIANQFVTFILGSEQRRTKTDGNGVGQVSLPLLALPDIDRDDQPDQQLLRATFGGTAEFASSFATQNFTINKQDTGIELSAVPGTVTASLTGRSPQPGGGVFNRPLGEETIFFIVRDQGGNIHQQAAVITNFEGQASLTVNPPRGEYDVFAYYSGPIPRPPESPDVELVDERYNPSAEAVGVVVVENSPPTAVDDFYTFDDPLTISPPGVLANDIDVDNDPLTVTQVISGPISGTLTIAPDGGFTYTPTLQFHGTDSFVYQVSDTDGLTDTATVSLEPTLCFFAEISPPEAMFLWPPKGLLHDVTVSVAGAEVTIVSVFQDEPVGKKQDAFIIDQDTVHLRAERLGSGNGRVYHIFFMADDGQGNVCASSVRVGVVPHDQSEPYDPALLDAFDEGPIYDSTIPGNIPPTAFDDLYTTTEDALLTIAATGVLSNDMDLDGDGLSVAAVNGDPAGVGFQISLSSNALLRLNSDGSFEYNPNHHFDYLVAGGLVTDTFTYQVGDGSDVSTATVAISVTGVNDAPTAVTDQTTTDEDTPLLDLDLLGNDTDPDDTVLSIISLETSATTGQATLTAGRVDYDPTGRFDDLAAGATATDYFSYTVSDPFGATATAVVTVTITGLAEPPVVNSDTGAATEDAPLNVSAPGVLGNDLVGDGGSLTISAVNGDAGTVNNPLTLASGALLTLYSDGSYTYDPNGQFEFLAVGEQASDAFSYTASNGAASSIGSVTITITGVNDIPTAGDDQAATAENQPVAIAVLGNDSDPDITDTLAVTSIDTTGTIGQVTNNNGTVTYNPNGQFDGLTAGQQAIDTFSYTVGDGNGGADIATVTVTINGVTAVPPTAANDAYSVAGNGALTAPAPGVLSNDSAAGGSSLTASLVAGPANGTLTLNANGSFVYSPNSGFSGSDSFTYQASDGAASSNVATVTITVNAVSGGPDAQDDAYTMNQGATLTISGPGVLGNDLAGDAGSLTVSAVNGDAGAVNNPLTLASGAQLTLNANGGFTFSPRSNFRGEDSFTYTINGGSDTATVTITVLRPNP